jgi:hypothetical protein
LRQLVVAASSSDVQLPGWLSILDRVGSPYDVLCADRDQLSDQLLVKNDVGRYNAVLLTSAALLQRQDGGAFASAFDAAAWSLLWRYERAYGVRQVVLNAAPGVEPEDQGLRPGSEGPTGPEPVQLRLTAVGATVFDYLRPDARLPLADAYVYRTRLTPGTTARPLLTLEDDVVAALATAGDGREGLVVCFTVGAAQPIEELLGYGLLRWATRGVLLGEHRHWLNVDIDDWCNLDVDGAQAWSSTLPAAGASTQALALAQDRLRVRYPLAAGVTLNLAYNGAGPTAWRIPVQARTADPEATPEASRPPADVRWVNHTFSHPSLHTASYEECRFEIAANLDLATQRGLKVDPSVLKTPGYSGLGVLAPAEGTRVLDQGLTASNPHLLAAARSLGVRYVHGNMSFDSHRPTCFNGGIIHPLQREIVVVPDWPTGIPWWAATPDEAVAGHPTWHAGADGEASGPAGYAQLIEIEAEEGSRHVMRGSVYTHTLHRANTYEYNPGRSLAIDWLDGVLGRYSALYAVPLKSPDWTALAQYVVARTAHAGAIEGGAEGVWDRPRGTVRLVAAADSPLFVTGAIAAPPLPAAAALAVTTEPYGTDLVSRVELTAGEELVLTARPRR